MLKTNAPWTNVTSIPATDFEIVEVYHLPGTENQGKRNVFVEVTPPDNSLLIGWTWDGRHTDEPAPPVPLEKSSPPGGAGDVPIFEGQRITVWLQRNGYPVSDTAGNLNGEIVPPAWDTGNSLYHHSYTVRFQKRTSQPPVDPPPSTDAAKLAAVKVLLQQALAALG